MQPCITGKKQGKTTRKHRSAAGATCCTELPNRPSKSPKRPASAPHHTHTLTQGEDHRRFCCFVQNTRPRPVQRHDCETGFPQSRLPRYLRRGFYKNTVRWTAVTGEHTCTRSTMPADLILGTVTDDAKKKGVGGAQRRRRQLAHTQTVRHTAVCKHFILNKQYSHSSPSLRQHSLFLFPSENIATNLKAALEDSSRVSPYHTTAYIPPGGDQPSPPLI